MSRMINRSHKVPSSQKQLTGDLEMKVDIHVLLYKRVDSAKLLLHSLSRTGGLTSTKINTADDATDMYIHIDRAFDLNHPNISQEKGILIGEESTTATQQGVSADLHRLAHEYQWQFGSKFVIAAPIKMGLKQTWLSINPDCGKKHAIVVFEDDIMPSGGWFVWASAIYSNIIQSSIETQRDIIGISLASLGINELKFPFEAWKPADIGGTEYYLHQVPNSWGSVYFCHPWQDFRRYAAARTSDMFDREELGGISLEGGRPGDPNFHIDELHSNWWSLSWKKYMVEYVYAKGMLTLYPNLNLDNIGLVMHLAMKGGEHMKIKNALFQKADWATYSMIQSAVGKILPLERANVFDIHFRQVANLEDLKMAGERYIESLRSKGPPYSDIASLLLPVTNTLGDDNDKHDGVQETQEKKNKMPLYLGYMPYGGLGNQLHSLAKAVWLSKQLDRILLIPHLFLPSKPEDEFKTCVEDYCLQFSDFLSFASLSQSSQEEEPLDFVFLTSGNVELFKPEKLYHCPMFHQASTGQTVKSSGDWQIEGEDPLQRNTGSATYFRSLPKVSLMQNNNDDQDVVNSILWMMKSINDRVLFMDDLTLLNITSIKDNGDAIARIEKDLYRPNTRLRRVVVDVMRQMEFKEHGFTCLHVPSSAGNEFCQDTDTMWLLRDYQDKVNQQRQERNNNLRCIPSNSQIDPFISQYILHSRNRADGGEHLQKLFIALDPRNNNDAQLLQQQYRSLKTTVKDGWRGENLKIKTSIDTKRYLLRRFPRANERFIDGMHAFVDQYLCILAEKAFLFHSSHPGTSSHQISVNRQGGGFDYWVITNSITGADHLAQMLNG